jgi:signal transduction histidine kinase
MGPARPDGDGERGSSAEELARLLAGVRGRAGGSAPPWRAPTVRSGVRASMQVVPVGPSASVGRPLPGADASRDVALTRPAEDLFGAGGAGGRLPLGDHIAADAIADLVVCEGELIGRRFRATPGVVLGRAVDADVQISDRLASRHHARIVAVDGALVIEDLDSHNGLFVNRERVRSRRLRAGDIIRIGDTPLAVHVRTAPRPAARGSAGDARAGARRPLPEQLERLAEVTAIVPERDLSPPGLSELSADQLCAALGIPDGSDHDLPDPMRRLVLRTRNFAVIYGICAELGGSAPLPVLLQRALEHLHAVTAATRGHVVLLEPETATPALILSVGAEGSRTGSPADLSHGIIDWVLRNRSAVVSSDAQSDERFRSRTSVAGLDLGSVLCVPMIHEGAVVGLIQLDRVGLGCRFSRDDLRLASAVAPVLAVVVRNARLHEEQQRSIEELSRAHRELVAAQEALVARERMAVIGRFAAGMAHEIRNTLTPMTLLDDVAEELPADSPAREDVALMRDALDRLRLLVEEIRLLARGQDAPLQLAERDLAQTVTAVLALLRCDPAVHDHRVVVQGSPLPPFRYDDARIKQVLVNLVHNAAQAMDRPGAILLRYGPDPMDAGAVLIEVRDEGHGIPPEALSAIWRPFFTTRGSDGTGLGLDVARRIAERHGGSLTCTSEVGQGTTMMLRLRREAR